MAKTLSEQFIDWESHVFGYGYGSGEPHVLPGLKAFFTAFGRPDSPHAYDYERLESAVGSTVAWLLINTLCHADVIEYGTSPRYGWLTDRGKRLQDFIADNSADELVALCTQFDSNYVHCAPDCCNCGPGGYEAGRICENQFFR